MDVITNETPLDYKSFNSFSNILEIEDTKYNQGIYFLYYQEQLVYIGKSLVNIVNRIKKHDLSELKFDSIKIYGAHNLSTSDISVLEVYLITKHKPIYNKDCNSSSLLNLELIVPDSVEELSTHFDYYSLALRKDLYTEAGRTDKPPVFLRSKKKKG